MLYIQYQLQNSVEYPVYGHPNTQTLTKKDPSIDIMLKSSQFVPLDNP